MIKRQVNMQYSQYATNILQIAIKAGEIIMSYYQNNSKIDIKPDSSPVTEADIAANDYIVSELNKLTPDINTIAEESENIAAINLRNSCFWLVDPLDGTKSFIKQRGDFTVNIGLIQNRIPIGGVIYVPVSKTAYFTGNDGLAYKQILPYEPELIHCREIPQEGVTAIASHSHKNSETDNFINNLSNLAQMVTASSSLKFCLLAEGKADIYPRFGRTMEWDTAAGHAILNAAGGKLTTLSGRKFIYGKNGWANGNFIAYGG